MGPLAARDFVVQCVKAWKSYTLALLLFKYLYARGSEALSQQQPRCFSNPEIHAVNASGEALLAAQAAGIKGTKAREAVASAATKLLCQVSTIDEAAVVIFGRFVSKPSYRRVDAVYSKQCANSAVESIDLDVVPKKVLCSVLEDL